MPLPAFNNRGDLPEGVYTASLDEVVARFGRGTPQRQMVTTRFRRIYALAHATGKMERFVIFGSYVTAKLEPNDIDIILVVRDDFREQDYDPEVFPMLGAQGARAPQDTEPPRHGHDREPPRQGEPPRQRTSKTTHTRATRGHREPRGPLGRPSHTPGGHGEVKWASVPRSRA